MDGEEEDFDLLEQEQWKRSGKAPAAKVIRTAPKIGVAKKPAMAVDAPPVFEVKERPAPSMQPAPHATSTATAEPKKKRSLFAQQRVNTADALPGPMSSSHMIFGEIVEKDTAEVSIVAPKASPFAFPPVERRPDQKDIVVVPLDAPPVRKSTKASLTREELHKMYPPRPQAVPAPTSANMLKEVEDENDKKLEKMSSYKMEQMRKEIFSVMDPKLIEALKKRGQKKLAEKPISASVPDTANQSSAKAFDAFPEVKRARAAESEELSEVDSMEVEKIKWMDPISMVDVQNTKKEKKSALEIDKYRFDFDGELLSYPSTSGTIELKPEDETLSNELYHHGDDPALPGYTMTELMRLSRSTVPGQRRSALRSLANIVSHSKQYKYIIPTHKGRSMVNSIILSYLLQDCKLALGLRHAIDDKDPSVVHEAICGLYALLCNGYDEAVYDSVESCWRGLESLPLLVASRARSSDKDESEKTEGEKVEEDVIMGLLDTALLGRFRFLIDVVRVSDWESEMILKMMLRIARHGPDAAIHMVECPDLILVLEDKFIKQPISRCTPVALRALRVMVQSSRYATKRLLERHTPQLLVRYLSASRPTPERISSDLSTETQEDQDKVFFECAVEATRLLNAIIRYNLEKSSAMQNVYQSLNGVLIPARTSSSLPQNLIYELQAEALTLLESMTLATLPDDSKDYQNIIWGDVSPLFHTIVTILAGLLSNQTIPTSGALFESRTRLIGWMLHFFASWFVCLPRQYDYSEAQEAPVLNSFVGRHILPLLQSDSIRSILATLGTNQAIWKGIDMFIQPSGATPALALKNLPTLFSGEPPAVPESSILAPRDVACRFNLVLGLLRLVDVLSLAPSSLADPSQKVCYSDALVSFLQSQGGQVMILAPLRDMLQRFVDYVDTTDSQTTLAPSTAASAYALYPSRIMQHCVFFLVKHVPSSALRRDATASLIARMLPGDEEMFGAVLQEVVNREIFDDKVDSSKIEKRGAILEFFKDYVLLRPELIIDEEENEDEENKTGADHDDEDVPTRSLLAPLHRSILPVGSAWPFLPISQYKQFFGAELMMQGELDSDEPAPHINFQAGANFIRDCLNFIFRLKQRTTEFFSRAGREAFLYGLMEVFSLDGAIYTDNEVAGELDRLLEDWLKDGCEIADGTMKFNSSVIEKVLDSWASESVGHPTIGRFVSMLFFTGALASSTSVPETATKKTPAPQGIESLFVPDSIKSVQATVYGRIKPLWYLLPPPPSASLRNLATAASMRTPSLIELYLECLSSPQVAVVQRKSGDEQFFYKMFIAQIQAYLVSEERSMWIRSQAARKLLSSPIPRNIVHEIVDDQAVKPVVGVLVKDSAELSSLWSHFQNE